MPHSEMPPHIDATFNLAITKMRIKILEAQAKGVDVEEQNDMIGDLALCWGFTREVFNDNSIIQKQYQDEYIYRILLKKRVDELTAEVESLKLGLAKKADEGEDVAGF